MLQALSQGVWYTWAWKTLPETINLQHLSPSFTLKIFDIMFVVQGSDVLFTYLIRGESRMEPGGPPPPPLPVGPDWSQLCTRIFHVLLYISALIKQTRLTTWISGDREPNSLPKCEARKWACDRCYCGQKFWATQAVDSRVLQPLQPYDIGTITK